MIARTPNLRLLYDDQAKAELDQFSALEGAREEGWEEGMAIGEARGRLIGRISLLAELLGDSPTSEPDLTKLSLPELQAIADDLQQRLDNR